MVKNFVKILLLVFFIITLALTGCGQSGRNNDQTEINYQDGNYTGYSDATDNGYAWAKVTITNHEIENVELMEITAKGNEKDYVTYDYEPSVKAHQEMPGRFEKANSAEVDIYTGATDSSDKYKQAVSRALQYAEGGLNGKYFDGQFQGASNRTEYGHAVALVTIAADQITDVQLKELTIKNEWKNFANYDYEPAVHAHEEMRERFVEANSINVDMYTEATQSSIRYKEAVQNALNHALKDPDAEIE